MTQAPAVLSYDMTTSQACWAFHEAFLEALTSIALRNRKNMNLHHWSFRFDTMLSEHISAQKWFDVVVGCTFPRGIVLGDWQNALINNINVLCFGWFKRWGSAFPINMLSEDIVLSLFREDSTVKSILIKKKLDNTSIFHDWQWQCVFLIFRLHALWGHWTISYYVAS